MQAGAEGEPHEGGHAARIATVVAYTVLGALLVASRTVGLDHSFWTDEITAVDEFVRKGPGEILSGPYLSHELFGIVAWLTSELVGESEVALRLWSVVPFVGGVALLTVWLHVRMGRLPALLFLGLATFSPLLLDITRQARGYGLAFLAMSALVVGALELERSGRTAALATVCVAGLVGTTTLPQFGIAFATTGAVLFAVGVPRRPLAVGIATSLVAIGAWYAPHLGQVRDAAQIEDGVRIGTAWLVTAPIDQILLPALIWIDGTALIAGIVWLPLVLLAAVVMGYSPLARRRATALLLLGGPAMTVLVLWIAQAYVIPRYLSYLLVPLFVLLATGMGQLLRSRSRAAIVPTVAGVVVALVLVVRFVSIAPDVMRMPREANRDAAAVVLANEPPPLAVVAHMRNPQNLEYYLGRPVVAPEPARVADRVCALRTLVAYVDQPFGIPPVRIPCLTRPGVVHYAFPQYARGDVMNVWLVPPR